LNRLSKRLLNGASENIEKYLYDGLGRMVTAKKGASGNDDSVSQSIFSFDSLSRLTNENQAIAEGTAKSVTYTYDKGGNQVSMLYHDGAATTTYAYDSRDRGTRINLNGNVLADYTWLGGAISKREITSDTSYTIGSNTDKMKFKTEFQRDGIMRVSKLLNELTTRDQASHPNLGSWDFTYDCSPSSSPARAWAG